MSFKIKLLDYRSQQEIDRAAFSNALWFVPNLPVWYHTYGQSHIKFIQAVEKLESLVYLFYFQYLSKELKRTIRLARPVATQQPKWKQLHAFSSLISYILKSEITDPIDDIEVEIYENIWSRIFFPSSSCVIDQCNTEACIDIFQKLGFSPIRESYCYDVSDMDSIFPDEKIDLKFRIRKFNNSKNDRLQIAQYSEIPEVPLIHDLWISDISNIFDSDDFIVFIEVQNKIAAWGQWFPNYYKAVEKNQNSLFIEKSELNELIASIGEAKISKFFIDDRFIGTGVEDLMYHHITELMKDKYGITRIHFGPIISTSYISKAVFDKVPLIQKIVTMKASSHSLKCLNHGE